MGQPSSACPRLQDRGHAHFLLTPRKAASSLPGAPGYASAGCGGQRGFQHRCQDDTRPHPDDTGSQGGRGLCLKKRSRLWKTDSAHTQGSCAGATRSQHAATRPGPGANMTTRCRRSKFRREQNWGAFCWPSGSLGGEKRSSPLRAPSEHLEKTLCHKPGRWGDTGFPGGGRGQGGKWPMEMPCLPGPSSPNTRDKGLAGPWPEGQTQPLTLL